MNVVYRLFVNDSPMNIHIRGIVSQNIEEKRFTARYTAEILSGQYFLGLFDYHQVEFVEFTQ